VNAPGTVRLAVTKFDVFDVKDTFKFDEKTLLTVRALETKTLRNVAVLDPVIEPYRLPVAMRLVAVTAFAE
jgi:hypothetical protein